MAEFHLAASVSGSSVVCAGSLSRPAGGIKHYDHTGLRLLNTRCSSQVGTDLHQVVVRSVQVFVQLNHQALKEGGELLLLLPRL